MPSPEIILTGHQITTLSSNELRRQLSATHICARIMPEQKLMIVNALKSNGEIVAMTGDGVNDAPALKAAHMGISMGLRGTDVARESSDMVLLDDNFASIVKAIREGRLIFDNIRKAVGYIIAVHIPIAFLALAPLLLGWPTILTPIHIIILELIIDPSSTLVFESEKADAEVMTRPPRSTKEKLFSKQILIQSSIFGIIISLTVLASYLISFKLGFHTNQIRTVAFITLIVSNTALIITSRTKPSALNKALLWILVCTALFISLVLFVPTFSTFMSLEAFYPLQLGLVMILGCACFFISESAKRLLVTYNIQNELRNH